MRKLWKLSLVKSLDEKGFTGDDREALYCFIDWLLALPENRRGLTPGLNSLPS